MFREHRLCGISGYQYKSGKFDTAKPVTTASTAIAALDAVKTSSGQILVATTGVKVMGVFIDTAKASSDTATTRKLVLLPRLGATRFLCTTKAGTLAAASENEQFDLSGSTGAMGITQAGTSNLDLTVYQVISTGTSGDCLVMFADPYSLNGT